MEIARLQEFTSPAVKQRQKSMKKFVRSEKYSDLIIECQGLRFPVHKSILCPRSSVISAELDNPAWIESQTGVIKHEVFDAHTLAMMLSYAYYSSYNVAASADELFTIKNIDGKPCPRVKGELVPAWVTLENFDNDVEVNEDMMMHVHVYGIAEYYDMPELKEMATMHFVSLTPDLDDTCNFIALMDSIAEYVPAEDTAMFDHVVKEVQKNDCTDYIWANPILLHGFKTKPSMQRLAGSLMSPVTTQARKLETKLQGLEQDCDDLIQLHHGIRRAAGLRTK
ncbi:hypothetical protein AMS68_007189 [Peltaster fructicola]|uniref:BTB domain-containing protein n=1 Tax=Peltaster fructicola TaxID=286661 RepID=A0A6H0Y3S1_9PEZI|nr:hypothetical protein AMS68_007189 [Peltaster fructicola]